MLIAAKYTLVAILAEQTLLNRIDSRRQDERYDSLAQDLSHHLYPALSDETNQIENGK